MKNKQKSKCNILNLEKSAFFAFTLAEVLITLGIIGIIASITIPILSKNIEDAQYKTAYKRAYSIASQAWSQAVTDGDIVPRPSWTDYSSRIANFKAFKSKFKVIIDCDGVKTLNYECWDSKGEGYNGSLFPLDNTRPVFVDSSGAAWADEGLGSAIILDTNGKKSPNQFGKDRFAFRPVVKGSDINITGLAVKLIPAQDYVNPNPNFCIHGGCYNTSWLYK